MRIIIAPAKKMIVDTDNYAVDGCRDLYQFWGSRLARQLGYRFCCSTSVWNHTALLWIQSPKD